MLRKIVILMIGLVFLMSTVQAGDPANVKKLMEGKEVNVREELEGKEVTVIKDIMCPGVAIVSGEITSFLLEGKEVITATKDIMICKGTLPADIPRPTKTIHLDIASIPGVWYSLSSGLTDNWKEVITPSGHVKLIVKLNLGAGLTGEASEYESDDIES